MMRAVVVLPTPRTPVSRKACASRPLWIAFDSVRTSASCPIIWAKVCGRYLRARTRYGVGAGSAIGLTLAQRVAARDQYRLSRHAV